MTEYTDNQLAELRRDAESWTMIGAERILPLLDALDNARAEAAERDLLAGLLDETRRSGCAVEIAGVRIAPCDERGQTADMRALDTAADRLAHMREARDNARAEVERLTKQAEAAETVTPVRTGTNKYAILIDSDLTEHTVRFIGTPDQLMQLAGRITTIARSIKSKEYKP